MNDSLRHEIVFRSGNGQSMRGIANDLGISRKRVAQVLQEQQAARDSNAAPHPDLPRPSEKRKSKLDDFEERMNHLLQRYPNITAVRMLEELRLEGYDGGYTILRERLLQLRDRPKQSPVIRFETPPGVQAQMDWAVYDIEFTQEGRRRVNLFSYILGYSRRQYIHFTVRQDFDTTIRQHICAFEHLQGVAATCLYDNMKVVVQRWEDETPVYNTRFLAFATHYGYQPKACRPRRPQTKGKVERPFFYIESNLLNGRTFRSLSHLNEVTRLWLSNVADTRKHRQTGKRPIDAHQEELKHLLPLPRLHFDTSQVVYRVANVEGFIHYRNNQYSVPWCHIGELLPIRITDDQLLVYNGRIEILGEHKLFASHEVGQQRLDPSHRPPQSHKQQLAILQSRFAEYGDEGIQFLERLLTKQRCGKHQAQKVVVLFRSYEHADVLAALQRAIKFHAYSYASLERILGVMATPRRSWETLTESQQKLLEELADDERIGPRNSSEYQHLLDDETEHADQSPDEKDEPGIDNDDLPAS